MNQISNSVLTIGLTGPLGSGCSMAGKYLAGIEFQGQRMIKDSLLRQVNQLDDLDKKINAQYFAIDKLKKEIKKNRTKSKEVGKFKKDIEKTFHLMENTILEREIYKSLKKFSKSENFNRKNINEKDIAAFGLKPFCYISFTTVIVKIAFEEYRKQKDKQFFQKYFEHKKKGKNDQEMGVFDALESFFKKKFDSEKENIKREYMSSNKFMKEKLYNFYLSSEEVLKIREKKPDLQKKLDGLLTRSFKFFVLYISYINSISTELKETLKKDEIHVESISEILQDWGDNIRATGNPFKFKPRSLKKIHQNTLIILPTEIELIISALAFRITHLNKKYKYLLRKKSKSDAMFIVECFRHPYEVEYFRSIFPNFFLFSISSERNTREDRLKDKFSKKRENRDEGCEKNISEVHKLDVRTCVLFSDIAIQNEKDKDSFFNKILRYLALIQNPGCIPPNDHELYMHIAYSQSLKSPCISRQVGAIILNSNGHILGAGWNAPGDGQIGCAHRTKEDLLSIECIPLCPTETEKARFHEILKNQNGDYICYKDIMSQIYVENKFPEDAPFIKDGYLKDIGFQLGIKRLEYCRSLHAEEKAIIQSAKIGGLPLENGVIYTTTYPCELCAKKLYQIGIQTIYYTEPYPESISEKVFLEDGTKTIKAIPFEGVKSHSYFKLFKPLYDKKDQSKIETGVIEM